MFYLFYICFNISVQFWFTLLFHVKHVQLIGFSFCLCSVLSFQVRVSGMYACTCLLDCTRMPYVCACILMPRNHNTFLLLLFLFFIHMICLCLSCYPYMQASVLSTLPLFWFVNLFNVRVFDLLIYHEHAYNLNIH